MRAIGELLAWPASHRLQAGSVALLAAIGFHAGRLTEATFPAFKQAMTFYEGATGSTQAMPPASAEQAFDPTEPGTPTIVKSYFENQAVVINALRCSGLLVRQIVDAPDQEPISWGKPVGALTADHCLDGSLINPQYKGADGKRYLVNPNGVTVAIGSKAETAQPLADIQQFVVPPTPKSGQWDTDQALAVFPGNEPKDVIKAWRQQQLPARQIEKLGYRTKIWLGGYPYPTNRSTIKDMPRQIITTRYVAIEAVSIKDSGKAPALEVETIHKTNANNTICSWGASGGGAVVIKTSRSADGNLQERVWPIGDFSGFLSFHTLKEEGGSRQTWSRSRAIKSYKYYHGLRPYVNLKDVDASCSYSYEPISPKSYRIINVVRSVDSIPAPAKKIN